MILQLKTNKEQGVNRFHRAVGKIIDEISSLDFHEGINYVNEEKTMLEIEIDGQEQEIRKLIGELILSEFEVKIK